MIPTVYTPATFTGNNSDSTAYVCPWKIIDVSHLRVTVTDADGAQTAAALENGAGITVAIVGNTVEFTTDTAYDSTYSLLAYLTSDFLQDTDLQNSGNNDVNVREAMFDKLTLISQVLLNRIGDDVGYPISFPAGEDQASITLPLAPNRADSFIYFDENGDLTIYFYATLLQNIIDYLRGDADAGAPLDTFIVDFDADFTVSQADAFKMWRGDASGGDLTVTFPADADANIQVGAKWDLTLVSGSNTLCLCAGSGATLVSPEGDDPRIVSQWAGVTVVKMSANTYQAFGRVSAS